MNLDIYNTHIELYPYVKGDIPALEKMYTAIDKFSQSEFPCGYMIADSKLYLPRGTQIPRIESMAGCYAKYITESDPIKDMSRKYYPVFEPRDKLQEESISFLKEDRHQSGLNLKMGKGKMEPNSRKIPTPDGFKLMGDLKPGDTIFGSNGSPIKVTNVFPQGIQDVYKVTFADGRYALCGLDHLWTAYDKNGSKKIRVLKLRDMMEDPTSFYVPMLCYPVRYTNKNIRESSYSTFGYDIITQNNGIPDECMYSSPIIRLGILDEILKRSRVEITNENTMRRALYKNNMSDALFNDIIFMIRGLGKRVDVYEDRIEFNSIKENTFMGINNIEYYGKEECTCISVDAKNELYLTEDFIVTHNTFCVAYAGVELKQKMIIITPNSSIKQQWRNTFKNMFEFRDSNICMIDGSAIITAIMVDSIEPADVYIVNHQTLRNYMSTHNAYELHRFFKKIGVGIKVYDESHMEFANIIMIDFFTNTEKTWYLTATFDRSDKTESACFKRAFNSVVTYGEVESFMDDVKHVVYHVVNINSRITPKNRAKLFSYAGFTDAAYAKYAFTGLDENYTAYNAILMILNKVKNLDGKILIFVTLIDAVDNVVSKLKKDFTCKSVGGYHSKMSKSDKDDTLSKDIIVSTIKSCGTGKDIPGLRVVISCENYASKVTAMQTVGRLRPYGENKDTYFFDIIDRCVPITGFWWNARYKAIQKICKDTIYLNMDK